MTVEYNEPCEPEIYLELPTPVETENTLSFAFSEDQAGCIAAEVYQPLLELIRAQQKQIDELRGLLNV